MARRGAVVDESLFVGPPVAGSQQAPRLRLPQRTSRAAGETSGLLIAWRCWVVVSWLLLVGLLPMLQHAIQAGLAATHNRLGPLADRIGHQHHAGQPSSAGPWPHHLLRPGDGLMYFVVPTAATVVWAAYRQIRVIRQPGTSRFAVVSMWTGGVVVVVAVLISAAAAWQPSRGVAVAVIQGLAEASGSLATVVSGFGL